MAEPEWTTERARQRAQDRLDWLAAQGPRLRPLPRPPMKTRLKQAVKAALLVVPVVGPWLFARAAALQEWAQRRPS